MNALGASATIHLRPLDFVRTRASARGYRNGFHDADQYIKVLGLNTSNLFSSLIIGKNCESGLRREVRNYDYFLILMSYSTDHHETLEL